MEYKFSDLVDIPKLQSLMAAFSHATGIAISILEPDGRILIAKGWQEICTKFHRIHRHTNALCHESDNYIRKHLGKGHSYIWYECANGLIDAVAPVMIEGEHVATLFSGQFFFDAPDVQRFAAQASRHGFNVDEYLAALAAVPIISQERLDSIMKYFIVQAEMLAEIGLARLKQFARETEKLFASDQQLFKIFNSTPNIAIQGYDLHGRFTFWNRASEELYGFSREESLGKCIDELIVSHETAAKFLSILKELDQTDQVHGPAEWVVKNKQGQEKTISATIFPITLQKGKEFIGMSVDITEQKLLEREMARLDRLDLIGEMAASIGHEIRNPMTTVRGYLQMLGSKPCFAEYEDKLALMIEELDRSDQIITEFLSLAKNKPVHKKPQNLNRIIEAINPLIYADAVKNNTLVRLSFGDTPDLPLDEKEIRQLLFNLVRNALEAMPSGGTIDIRTFTENGEVILAIQDTGNGIPKEIIEKIGTPFFTTKEQGTGLGLAICFSIATRHNAKISIESTPFGTTFLIHFSLPEAPSPENQKALNN